MEKEFKFEKKRKLAEIIKKSFCENILHIYLYKY